MTDTLDQTAKQTFRPSSKGQGAEHAAKEATLRAKAARQAQAVKTAEVHPDMVQVRVMKSGDSKISTGEHVAGIGEVHFEQDETFPCARDTAESYEARGWVEILK